MKSETIIFNGGLQTKVAPHLAEPNYALECENIDLDKGSIYPVSEWITNNSVVPTGYYCTYHNDIFISSVGDEVRSYAKLGTRTYFTNADSGSFGLYRIKDDGTIVDAEPPTITTFNFIADIDIADTSYTDSIRDIDVSRIELNSFDSYAPKDGIDNLVENNGTMWASLGDKVYFSANGRPEIWNPLDFLVLNDTCTGLASYRNGVLAFTEGDTYIITGFNRDNVAIEKLPYQEGCIGHATIANITEYVLWTSKNGVCIFDGATIDVITKDRLVLHLIV
jgi:hypothetical protein